MAFQLHIICGAWQGVGMGVNVMKPAWILALSCFAVQLLAGELEIIGDGFRFTEGPATDSRGNVYFTDIPAQRIYVYRPDGRTEVYRENSGKANGLFFDRDGNLLVCEGGNNRLTSISPQGKVTVLADTYDGKPFNRPNDLWIDPKGGVYFTDPVYGKAPLPQGGEHVYYLLPDRSRVMRVIDDFVRPNGIIGTPDGGTLYVADHGDGKIWKYAIGADGTLHAKTLFAECASDGMTLDAAGNLYATQDSVRVYNPRGELIDEIKTPKRPANVTFCGDHGRTLFITARSIVCKVELDDTRGHARTGRGALED
jgi:gluconolactonase